MERLNPWKSGTTLAVVVGINYLICTAIWMTWREPSIDFLNALFHGMDFRKLETSGPFSILSFIYVLVGLMIWTFVIGVIFRLVSNWFRPHVQS